MTSGTANESKLDDILSTNVVFPTESFANPNNEENMNSDNQNEEEEEEIQDEELKDDDEEQESNNDKRKADEQDHVLEIQQEQIIFDLLEDDKEKKNDDKQNELPSEDAINEVSEKFLRGEKVKTDDPTLLAHVVTNLENKRDQLMIDGDFQNSIKTQKAVDSARSKQIEAVKKQTSDEQLEVINKKQAKLVDNYERFESEMRKAEEELENDINAQKQALSEKHQKQIQDHDENWQKEVKLRQYNRASQRLRVLRTQQQLLMNAKRFDEAEQVCKIADDVAQKEALESHKQMLTAYKNSRRKLEEKQADEMDTFLRTSEQRRDILQHQKEVLTRPYVNRIKNLKREQEIAKDPDRLWILRHRNDDKKINNCYSSAQKNTKTTQQQTQTVSQEKKKGALEFNKLVLPPLFDAPPPATSPKKGRTNNSHQNKNASRQKANTSNQDAEDSVQESNPPAQKTNAKKRNTDQNLKHPNKTFSEEQQ